MVIGLWLSIAELKHAEQIVQMIPLGMVGTTLPFTKSRNGLSSVWSSNAQPNRERSAWYSMFRLHISQRSQSPRGGSAAREAASYATTPTIRAAAPAMATGIVPRPRAMVSFGGRAEPLTAERLQHCLEGRRSASSLYTVLLTRLVT